MDVPAEILTELKCETCGTYLSRSPVFVQQNMTGVCNQCVTPEHPSTRNKQYESVAKLLKFPCKYRELGCPSTVPFVEGISDIPHEEECSFRQYPCLVLGSNDCDFLGNRDEMLAHCRQQHADHVVESPVTLTHDIIKSSVRTYLLVAFKLLFLLNTKVCVTSGKIFHAVHLLGDSTKAEDFSFTVDVKRNGEGVSKKGKVEPQGCLDIKESISMALGINSLLDVLGGFPGTTFTVALKKAVSCAKCQKEVLRYTYNGGKGWWCEECAPKKRDCKNQSKGCTYRGINVKCEKHDALFCAFTKKCPICCIDKDISEDTLPQHYNSAHMNETTKAGSIWRASKTDDSWRCRLISCVAGTALCEYRLYDSLFTFDVHIPVASDCLSEFRCTIRVARPGINDSRTFTPDTFYTDYYDWRIVIKNDEFPWPNDGFDVSVDISKIQ